jgi:negative regulator of sigma E activity
MLINIGTRNPVVMFVAGAAVTLAIVLVVIFVIQIYKRRRQASKLSSSVLAVDTIEMQNETAPEASQNNQVSVSKAFCS